ncbi:hypothetical protein E4U47_002855 [Claviceps purpurea]|nr:hypothetical protein E4U12_001230 [Claviceps purpurea]KAG6173672.1 hypothetical protein E4U51_004767 [Claviceps purpurea]KAG6197256.1 hypothetical protein E4U10_000141 [Claviceps purpurea]KAG6279667.1 hypothetical protein E4U47_002855 [Claviceps purpurea]KAG6307832.1 hypothetical protein E4U45_003319 [Claviceps purpurea]
MAMESPIRVDAGESDCVERDPRFPVQFIKVDRDRETSRIDTTKRTREQKAGVSEKGIGYVEIARRR